MLVKQMLRQAPELETLLDIPLPVPGQPHGPIDPEVFRKQAAAAFFGAGDEWQSIGEVEEGLLAITSMGTDFLRQQEYTAAAAVYQAVAGETLKQFDTFHDESGAMQGVLSDCIDGLGACLEGERDEAARERISRALFDIYRFDIEFGGIGMSDGALEAIFDHATVEERSVVAGWVREAIPGGGDWSSNWRRQAFGGLLLSLEEETLDDNAYLQLCRDTGRTHDLVDRLLSMGSTDGAVETARQAGDYDLLTMAAIFDQHERNDEFEKLMEERAQSYARYSHHGLAEGPLQVSSR